MPRKKASFAIPLPKPPTPQAVIPALPKLPDPMGEVKALSGRAGIMGGPWGRLSRTPR
jgi:hypothetical protein